MKLLLALWAMILFITPLSAQPHEKAARSATATPDTLVSLRYYETSRSFWQKNADSVQKYGNLALNAARNSGYRRGEAFALLSLGVGYDLKEENAKALNAYLESLRIVEKIKDSGLTCNLYNNIGNIYSSMEDYPTSNRYLQQALQLNLPAGDRDMSGVLLTNMADNFKNLGRYDSALVYNFRALPLAAGVKDSVLMAAILLNTGEDYCGTSDFQRAMDYFHRCRDLATLIHDDQDLAWALVSMADVLSRQGSYSPSIDLACKALDKARRLSFTEIIRKSYGVLYADYRSLKKFDVALTYRNLEVFWKDSLFGIEKNKRMGELQSRYELDKKEYQLDILRQKALLNEKEVQTERQRHFMFAGAALFFSLWAIFLYRGNREVDRLNRQLRARCGNPDITG